MNFTLAQQQVIETIDPQKHLHIVAVAGSGKTQTIAQRIINLLKNGINPSEIVSFTYTEKAAAELKNRVLKLGREQLGSIQGMAELYIGTIHSWCLHFLKDEIYGFQKYEILDEIKLKMFVDKYFNKIEINRLNCTTSKGVRPLRIFTDTSIFLSMVSVFREADLIENSRIDKDLIDVIDNYEKILKEKNYLDFGMILTEFYKEIQKETVKEKIKSKIKYLIVDEYQDINHLQENIIESICSLGVNLCVVGDDDQTIYQWRGSDVKNILNFKEKYKKYGEVITICLDDNFRSSNAILDLASVVTNKIKNRLDKKMMHSSHQQFEDGDLQINEFSEREKENQYLVDNIQSLIGCSFKDKESCEDRGIDYGDICILLRKWKPATEIANALNRAGIPFVVTGVNQLFKQDEIIACKIIYEFLQDTNNIEKREQLKTSWLKICPNLSETKLEIGLNNLLNKSPKSGDWYEDFNLQKIFKVFREDIDLKESSFGDFKINNISKGEVAFYNLGMFSQIIQDFETIHFKDDPIYKLKGFLNFLTFTAKDIYPEGWLNKSNIAINAVKITSIHQSKGLEWPVVFLPRLNANYFPAKKVGGVKVSHLIDTKIIKDYERYEGTKEDELRLLYVAITRAKKFLFISCSPSSSNQDKKPSEFIRFLRECPYLYSTINYEFIGRLQAELKDRLELEAMLLNFSILESYFKCPYAFKYYTCYGFKEPLESRIGFGKSIHDALMEIHKKSIEGISPHKEELEEILNKHLNLPYAIPKVKEVMRQRALKIIDKYYENNHLNFKKIEFVEKDIIFDLSDGIIVNGRIDLVIQKDDLNNEKIYIVDFKSKLDSDEVVKSLKNKEIIQKQLNLYAIGYEELTGKRADFTQIYDLETQTPINTLINKSLLQKAQVEIREAGLKIKNDDLRSCCSDVSCVCKSIA